MRRRNPTCEARDCPCECHLDGKARYHCHPGRKCRDVDCVCILGTVDWWMALPLSALFPKISVDRGGIRYPMSSPEDPPASTVSP